VRSRGILTGGGVEPQTPNPHLGTPLTFGMEKKPVQENMYIMFGVKKTRILCSKRHNHGGITIIPGVEEIATSNA